MIKIKTNDSVVFIEVSQQGNYWEVLVTNFFTVSKLKVCRMILTFIYHPTDKLVVVCGETQGLALVLDGIYRAF